MKNYPRTFSKLLPEFREVILLRYTKDMEYEEIAEVLNISVGTVKSRISRGKDKLKKILTNG